MRRLIINADDFGLTSGVNRAILEAHTDGLVSSATLMANAAAFDDAVQRALQSQRLGVGCHVVLVDGSPILDARQAPSLIDPGKGRFRNGAGSFGLATWAGRVDRRDISVETAAQIGKLESAGIRSTHLDTHKHVHMFPKVLRGVLSAAQAWGVRAIRNPFEPLRFIQLTKKLGSRKRWLQVKMLNTLAADFGRTVKNAGLITPDGSLGVVATGVLDHERFRDLIQNCPEGTWELVCHPGYLDKDLNNIRTCLRQSRAIELELLTSASARDLLQREGIELISYRDIV
jgi:hopanoid biosynthesis associated protein HpnK